MAVGGVFHSLRLNIGGEAVTIPVNDLANHESKKRIY